MARARTIAAGRPRKASFRVRGCGAREKCQGHDRALCMCIFAESRPPMPSNPYVRGESPRRLFRRPPRLVLRPRMISCRARRGTYRLLSEAEWEVRRSGRHRDAVRPRRYNQPGSCRRQRSLSCKGIVFVLVRSRGIEPPRLAAPTPQAGASTNSATTAYSHRSCSKPGRRKQEGSRVRFQGSGPRDGFSWPASVAQVSCPFPARRFRRGPRWRATAHKARDVERGGPDADAIADDWVASRRVLMIRPLWFSRALPGDAPGLFPARLVAGLVTPPQSPPSS